MPVSCATAVSLITPISTMDLDSSSVGSTMMAHNPQSLVQGPVKGPYTTLSTAATSAATTTGTTATTNTSPRTTIPIMASTEVPTTTGAAAGPRDLHSSQPGNFDPQNADFDPLSDWPPRILLEMKDMLLLLASDGRIVYASSACLWITGYEFAQINRQDITRFIHTEDRAFFAAEMDDCIANSRPFHCHFRFYKRDNASCVLEAYGHPHMANSKSKSGSSNENQAQICNGVILVCRPYPTKSSQTLDSFLEHKLENIRLLERIAQLRAEEKEEEDINAGQQPATGNQTSTTHTMQSTFITSVRSSFTQSNAVDANGSGDDSEDSSDESDSRSILEQGEDQVPQTDDMSHIAGIELITGLNYGAGERSQGLSTGQRYGRLINCNKGSSSPDSQEQDLQDSDRRKRLKGEYMCTDCGTADSPEWRKGPEGPKTLCNACGLRWAKKEKKRQDPI